MEVPLSRFLTRFSFEDEPIVEPAVEEPEVITAPAVDATETLVAAALTEATARHTAEVMALKAEHAAASETLLADARRTWCETEGEKVARHLDSLVSDLRNLLSEKIGDALIPIATQAVMERTREALLESVGAILADPDHAAIAIHAPEDLLEAMRAAHPQVTGIRYVADDKIDAAIVGDGFRVETRLATALSTLAETGF
jgi:hypothetical protein